MSTSNLEEPLTAEKTAEIPPSPENGSLPADKETSDMQPLETAAPAFTPSRGFLLAFISICIITLAAALDATSLSIALPIITEKLKGTAIEAFWSGTSFLLTSAVFQPVIAGLSHVFGRKQVRLKASEYRGPSLIIHAACSRVSVAICNWLHRSCSCNQLHYVDYWKKYSGHWRWWNLDFG
jgi:hypothetical protein